MKKNDHCARPIFQNENIIEWLFGYMEHKGNRTLALDHGGVLTLKIFSCSLCHQVTLEEDTSVKPLPPYEM